MSTRPGDVPTIGSPDDSRTTAHSTSEADRVRWVRVVAGTLGGTLMVLGFRRRTPGRTALALAGGWLFYWSIFGYRPRSEMFETGAESSRRDDTETPMSGLEVAHTMTIRKSADELYRDWRESENLTQIAGHFASVNALSEDRHRWNVDGPLGWNQTWETQIVEDRPGEFLRWESLEGANLPNDGSVQFRPAPGDRGTEVTLRFRFDPPGGTLGSVVVNRLDIVPRTLASTILHRFKSLAEAGEIPTLEHNPSARGSGDLL